MDLDDLITRIDSEHQVSEAFAIGDVYWQGYRDALADLLRWVGYQQRNGSVTHVT